MPPRRHRRPAPPLDSAKLRELALGYAGRFATTRAKLRAYLLRKIRERGWAGEREPDVAALAEALAERGYVNDPAYALTKSQALTSRGYGPRRVHEKLREAGIEGADGVEAQEHAAANSIAAAIKFAARRRIGPFASADGDHLPDKGIAAMIRAGHPFSLARTIAHLPPEEATDPFELEQRLRDQFG